MKPDVVAMLAVGVLLAATRGPAQTTRLVHGALLPCPDTPNCVSSQATDDVHRVAPLLYHGSPEETRDRLQRVLAELPRMRVISGDAGTLHVTFTTKWLRFTDDVDFLFDDEARVIHVRSASRVGYSDRGVNRQRVEQIRAAYEAAEPTP